MKKDISFYSEGLLIKGNIYIPENIETEEKLKAIILCHGFAGIKEMLLPNFAEKFSNNGYLVMTFDYRGFGESEGERGRIVPNEQIQDIRNAITFLKTVDNVDGDKIALWGTSLGGANALVATALDNRVKCLAVQITFANGFRNNTSAMNSAEIEKLQSSLEKMWTNSVVKNKTMKIPLKKVLSDEQSQDFFKSNIDAFPEALSEKIPFITTKLINEFKPEDYFNNIDVPVLVVGAENDIVNLPSESTEIYNRLNTEKKEIFMAEATHYDIYVGENFDLVSDKQLEWFNKYL